MPHSPIVTIFGATGFIGRQLVPKLAAQGRIIRVVTRNPAKARALQTAGQPGQITVLTSSLGNDTAVRAMLKGADAVVNLLGILYETRRQTFETVHHHLPARLAQIAAQEGVGKFVQISAIGANAKSRSAYARSKAAGEQAVFAAFPTATILRPSIVFGPEDDFFNRFAGLTRISPFLPLVGGGKTLFQPVYVGDVAQAIVAALTRPEAAGRIYELGGPQALSFKQLLQMMLEQTQRCRLLLPLPFGMAKALSLLLQLAPRPMLTPDQVELLRVDNVVHDPELENIGYLWHLGIKPTPLQAIIPHYLSRFIPGGPHKAGKLPHV